MSWTGKPCPFTIQILIQITIFKMMAIHDTLVSDSENWCTYCELGLFFPVVLFMLYHDKGLLELVWICHVNL